jgi:DNA-binding NarL/FixJ family response regulator
MRGRRWGAIVGRVPPTVLIVDDHADFRTVARALLEDGGYRVVGEAATGGEALEAAAGLCPQVVLLDVQLPDVDGFTVSRELRRLDLAIKVVLCSVRARSDYGAQVDSCGACGFLAKSQLSADALTRIVTAC